MQSRASVRKENGHTHGQKGLCPKFLVGTRDVHVGTSSSRTCLTVGGQGYSEKEALHGNDPDWGLHTTACHSGPWTSSTPGRTSPWLTARKRSLRPGPAMLIGGQATQLGQTWATCRWSAWLGWIPGETEGGRRQVTLLCLLLTSTPSCHKGGCSPVPGPLHISLGASVLPEGGSGARRLGTPPSALLYVHVQILAAWWLRTFPGRPGEARPWPVTWALRRAEPQDPLRGRSLLQGCPWMEACSSL